MKHKLPNLNLFHQKKYPENIQKNATNSYNVAKVEIDELTKLEQSSQMDSKNYKTKK